MRLTEGVTSFYKIRRRSDGKFSTGGVSPGFTAIGKMWKSEGTVRAHLRMAKRSYTRSEDYELVQYHVAINLAEVKELGPVIDDMRARAAAREQQRRAVSARTRLRTLEDEAARLRLVLGDKHDI